MAQPFIGQILAVGFNYAPIGWLSCDGQLVPISQFEPLYALIGTTYGGDGNSTFGLPNLNGRTPIGVGQGPGRSSYVLGQTGGSESVTLTSQQVGGHNHAFVTSGRPGGTATPDPTTSLGANAQPAAFLYATAPADVTMAVNAITPTGGGAPHENRQPLLALNYIICTDGLFPPRS